LLIVQVSQQFTRNLEDDGIHLSQKGETTRRDVRPDGAAVVFVALLSDEFERLQARQQAGYVGFGGYHSVADGGTREPVRLSGAKNAQHIVLRGCHTPFAGFQMEGAMQAVGGAHQVEKRLLLHAGEGSFLHDFKSQAGHRQFSLRGGVL